MTGYKPQKKQYTLTYTDYPGLTVIANAPVLGELLDSTALTINLLAQDEVQRIKAFTTFINHVLTWNVLHPDIIGLDACPRCGLASDQPLPTTVDALKCLDVEFVIAVVMGWATTVASVTLPKGLNLSDGTPTIDTLMKQLGEMQNR